MGHKFTYKVTCKAFILALIDNQHDIITVTLKLCLLNKSAHAKQSCHVKMVRVRPKATFIKGVGKNEAKLLKVRFSMKSCKLVLIFSLIVD